MIKEEFQDDDNVKANVEAVLEYIDKIIEKYYVIDDIKRNIHRVQATCYQEIIWAMEDKE